MSTVWTQLVGHFYFGPTAVTSSMVVAPAIAYDTVDFRSYVRCPSCVYSIFRQRPMNLSIPRLRVVLALAAIFLGGARDAVAGAKIESVAVGLGRQQTFKVGVWAPVDVIVADSGTESKVEVTAPDPDGRPVHFDLSPLPNSKFLNGNRRFSGLIQCGRTQAEISIRLREGDQVVETRRIPASSEADSGLDDIPTSEPVTDVAKTHRALRQSTQIWGLVSPEKTPRYPLEPFRAAVRGANQRRGDLQVPHAVRVVSWRNLNEVSAQSGALEALDVLVLARDYDVDAAHSQAIQNWVRRGGQLVVIVGLDFDAFAKSPLAAWCPDEVNGKVAFREVGSINSRVTTKEPFIVPSDNVGQTGARILLKSGTPLIAASGNVVLSRATLGWGTVTLFAFDFEGLVGKWSGAPDLAWYLADGPQRVPTSASAEEGIGAIGISELHSQILTALDNFPGVERPDIWVVLGLIAACLCVLGPLDYFLTHRVLKRPHATWLTSVLWIALAVGAGVTWARSTNHPSPTGGVAGGANAANLPAAARFHQWDLVDLDGTGDAQQSQSGRVHSWLTLYSPETRRYQVTAAAVQLPKLGKNNGQPSDCPTESTRLSWQGRPEEGFRGMYRNGGIDFGATEYRVSPAQAQVNQFPISVWSSGGVAAQSELTVATADWFQADLMEIDGHRLGGTIAHQFAADLEDWVLVYGQSAYHGHNATANLANKGIDVEDAVVEVFRTYIRDIRSEMAPHYTTGTSPSKADLAMVYRSTKYDPLATDPTRIFQALTFFEAAGGPGHTSLENQSLRQLDLSPQVALNRAVFLARLRTPSLHYTVNGSPISTDCVTFLRVLLPVKKPES